MSKSVKHIYFVPGLAASIEIFKNIKLPENEYKIHYLKWIIPEKRESISAYAARMAKNIEHSDFILAGVSFGGVVAQEMSLIKKPSKLIIISSIKTRAEMPTRFRFLRATRLYHLVPTSLIVTSKDLTRYAVGSRSRKRLKLYNEFLHVRDKKYLPWAIKNMIKWKRTEPLPNVVHLHGDSDIVFPIAKIKNAIICPNGTHVMILYRAKWIAKKIMQICSDK